MNQIVAGIVPVKVIRITHTIKETVHADGQLQIAVANNIGLVASSAAWPIAAVVVAHLFKSELTALLGRIRSFKALGVEASLDMLIQDTLPPLPPSDEIEPEQNDSRKAEPALNPVETIITSWLAVEKALDRAVPASAGQTRLSIRSKLNYLSQIEQTPTGLKERILELLNIRNRLAHTLDYSVSEESMRLYRENADRVIRELSSITAK